jgi:hypothetical protein
MTPAGAIGKLGFRKWYERELLLAHAWLAACVLCAFAALALVEGLNLRRLALESLPALAAAFAGGMIAWYALTRYFFMVLRAQRLAERSTCPQCGTYGRYRLVGATPRDMTVCCRKCAREWRID